MIIYKTAKEIKKAHESGELTPEDYVKSIEQMEKKEIETLRKTFKRGESYIMEWEFSNV